jgi:nucleoside-diphosphate-sugar epimerase
LRVLVTGANGFVGSNLARYLRSKNFEIVTTDVDRSDVNGDLTDPNFVNNTLATQDFDALVHLAGMVNIPKSIADPYGCYRINCFATLNLLNVAAEKGINRFIYASSNNVYGPPKRLPVREEDPYNPRAPYDYSKVVSENFVKSFNQHKALPTVVLRSWNLFGPNDQPTRAVPRFMKACLANEPIPLYNGGKDADNFYHVNNYCEAATLALTSPKAAGEVFNVGTGRETSVRQLAEMVKMITGSKSKLQMLPPRTPLEAKPRRTYPSISKIKRVLGYKPILNLKEGLEQTLKSYREISGM